MDRRSHEMARSGDYPDHVAIEHALRAEGYPEAHGFLDDRFRRWYLNKLCNDARRARGLPVSASAADGDKPFVP